MLPAILGQHHHAPHLHAFAVHRVETAGRNRVAIVKEDDVPRAVPVALVELFSQRNAMLAVHALNPHRIGARPLPLFFCPNDFQLLHQPLLQSRRAIPATPKQHTPFESPTGSMATGRQPDARKVRLCGPMQSFPARMSKKARLCRVAKGKETLLEVLELRFPRSQMARSPRKHLQPVFPGCISLHTRSFFDILAPKLCISPHNRTFLQPTGFANCGSRHIAAVLALSTHASRISPTPLASGTAVAGLTSPCRLSSREYIPRGLLHCGPS